MKLYIFIFSILISLNSFSQKSNLYHLLSYKIGGYYYNKQYDSCKVILNEIEEVGYIIHPHHLKLFVKSAIMIDDTLKVKKYLEMLVSKTNNDTSFIAKEPEFRKIRNYSWWNSFVKEYDSLKLYYYNNFDLEYSIKLRNMLYLDQYLRTKYPDSLIKNYNISLYIDNDNFLNIKHIIQQKGFPKYSEVGYKGIKAVYLILMHSTTYSESRFHYIDSLLKSELAKNNFLPWMYANIIDRYYRNKEGYQIYGSFIEKDNMRNNTYGKIINIKELDKRRYDLGLYSFYNFAQDVKIKTFPKEYHKLDLLNYYYTNK